MKPPPEFFVVDDDASVRRAIHRLLRALHLPVRLFPSAEDFTAAVREGDRGCLILDLRLPGMSGLQLLAWLAERQWRLPAVVVTAHDDDESREAALRLGATAYLRKPFDRELFVKAVHEAIAQTAI